MEALFGRMISCVNKTPSVVVRGLLALIGHIPVQITPSLLMTVAIKVLIDHITRILYNIFLHPLAKLPGPLVRSGF